MPPNVEGSAKFFIIYFDILSLSSVTTDRVDQAMPIHGVPCQENTEVLMSPYYIDTSISSEAAQPMGRLPKQIIQADTITVCFQEVWQEIYGSLMQNNMLRESTIQHKSCRARSKEGKDETLGIETMATMKQGISKRE